MIEMPSYRDALFCDETGTHGGPYMHLGAIRCSHRRSEILAERLHQVRQDCELTAEMKWTKVSHGFFDHYKKWVDIFLDEPYCRMFVLRVSNSLVPSRREQSFFEIYRYFLLRSLPPKNGCFVYVDGMTIRRKSLWSSLSFLVNRSRRENWSMKNRNIKFFEVVDNSRDNDLIQLTDVLLGAFTTETVNVQGAKFKLAQYVRQRVTFGGYGAKVCRFEYPRRAKDKRA